MKSKIKAKIYRPTKNAMQSGTARTKKWVLEFDASARPYIEPLMGWNAMVDTNQQLKLYFDTQKAAEHYAQDKQLDYRVTQPKERTIVPKSYAANFAYDKVET
jgi:outer membrane protein assembly factor BamE (lipoprotein component of BamABCDE complex)